MRFDFMEYSTKTYHTDLEGGEGKVMFRDVVLTRSIPAVSKGTTFPVAVYNLDSGRMSFLNDGGGLFGWIDTSIAIKSYLEELRDAI